MIGDFLGKLFSVSGVRLLIDGRMAKDLGRLDKARSGLANQAIRYVLTGEGGEVLSTLATIDPGAVYGPGWSSHDPIRFGRASWLARSAPDVATALRYAEVIAVLERQPARLPGFADTPLALRAYVEAAARGLYKSDDYVRTLFTGTVVLTPDFLAELTTRAGGGRVDLWGVLFANGADWSDQGVPGRSLREALDLAPLARQDPAALEAAMKRLGAEGRADLIAQLGIWRVLDCAPLRQMVLGALGDSAKSVREAARNALLTEPAGALQALVAPLLASGQSQVRLSAAEILAGMQTPEARALLDAHLAGEKVSAIRSVIETARVGQDTPADTGAPVPGGPGYLALDGSFIAIPPMRAARPVPGTYVDDADIAALDKLVRERNERQATHNKTYRSRVKMLPGTAAQDVADLLNRGPQHKPARLGTELGFFVFANSYEKWLKRVLPKIPPEHVIAAVIGCDCPPTAAFAEQDYGVGKVLIDCARLPGVDFRLIDALFVASGRELTYGR